MRGLREAAHVQYRRMPRKPRSEFPGAIHHVTIRGVNRRIIFRDDADCWAFVQLLQDTCEHCEWRVLAYCLMDNHAHLLVHTAEANLGPGMQRLSSSYARRSHNRYRSSGHVFQGRYHALVVQRDAYLLEVFRYILLNPVRAGLCRHAVDWRWSSAREALGLRPLPAWMDLAVVSNLLESDNVPFLSALKRFLNG